MENSEKKEKRREKEIYKPKKRIGDLGLEEQFAKLTTGDNQENGEQRKNGENRNNRGQHRHRGNHRGRGRGRGGIVQGIG